MRKWLVGSVVLGAIAGGCVWGYPRVVRHQIEKRAQGVGFRDFHLSRTGLTLEEVTVNRGWVRGTVDHVRSDFRGEHVEIEGGSLTLDLDAREKEATETEGSGTRREITFRGLTLEVRKGKHVAHLEGARSEGTKVCFDRGTVVEPSVTVGAGCVERDGTEGTVTEVGLGDQEYGGVRVSGIRARGVRVWPKEKRATAEHVEATLGFEGQIFPVEVSGLTASRSPDHLRVESVRVRHPWLAPDWTTLTGVEVSHPDKWEVALGASKVRADSETLTFSGDEECGTWVGSLPEGLRTPPLDTLRFTGRASFTVGIRPTPTLRVNANCRVDCRTIPNLRKPFSYTAYTSKGEPFVRESGRGTKGWVPLGATGDVPLAVVTMEDPGFRSHRGFLSQAFANSLTDNLRQGRFVRGGSTLTMQLAKNLWLTREKTLTRKIQELFLAQAIESCYSKEEILETYLNVVEFGPDRYGVGAGSEHWFRKGPSALSHTEAFWLASILPRPSRTSPPTEASFEHIEKLMKRFAEDGRIPDFFVTEIEEGDEDGWDAAEEGGTVL